MFVTELEPLFKELTHHPVSFLGGFFSGMLRLNLSDEPVKSWIEEHLGSTTYTSSTNGKQNGKTSGPQSISID